MPSLYINSRGKPWTRHSYSAGQLFDKSAYWYYIQKVLGWKERDTRASFGFGHDLEAAIQHHHEHDGEGALNKFVELWTLRKDTPNMKYTNVESDWETCLQMGREMISLYIIKQPSLPIPLGGRAIFQREYEKEIFPNDPNYGGIFHTGRLDIVSFTDPAHPLLPKVDWQPSYGLYRPLVCDIKTSANDFGEQPGLCSFDIQLRTYSWLSGIRDVCFPWFVKKGLGYKKGYSVTLLTTAGGFEAGTEAVIAKMTDEGAWLLHNDYMVDEMTKQQGVKEDGKTDQTNIAKQRAMNFLEQHGALVSLDSLTKQRFQFNAGFVSERSAADAGLVSSRQVQQIVNASKNNEWPDTSGVRYPKDDRNDPYFRAFSLKDEVFREQNFSKLDEQQFDSLFDEDNNAD